MIPCLRVSTARSTTDAAARLCVRSRSYTGSVLVLPELQQARNDFKSLQLESALANLKRAQEILPSDRRSSIAEEQKITINRLKSLILKTQQQWKALEELSEAQLATFSASGTGSCAFELNNLRIALLSHDQVVHAYERFNSFTSQKHMHTELRTASISNLGKIQEVLGDSETSKALHEQAKALATEKFPITRGSVLNLYGQLLLSQQQMKAARETFTEAHSLLLAAKNNQPDEEVVDDLIDTCSALASISRFEKDWNAAEGHLGAAIKHAEAVYGRGSIRVASLLYLVALMLQEKGWTIYAEGLFKKAIDIYDTHRYTSRESLAMVKDYAAMLRKLERSSDADRLMEKYGLLK